MIKIVLVKVGKEPEVQEMENSLEAMQALVDGYIEVVRIGGDAELICNEEGIRRNLKFNRLVGGHVIHGDFFLTTSGFDGENVSLTPTQIEKLLTRFKRTEAS